MDLGPTLPRWCKWQRICLPMPEMWEMQVRFLGWEDPLEEEMATHSSILALSHGERSLMGYSSRGLKELNRTERTHILTNPK